jgi:LPPG:FO 2-phospho-L-lactate transferase
VSLGPIFGLQGVRKALTLARDRVVAISPIVGGRTIKGPADKMLRGLGLEVSALGIARLYKDIVGTFVLDKIDRAYLEPIRELGMRAVAADTIMITPAKAARLARIVIEDSSRLSDSVI